MPNISEIIGLTTAASSSGLAVADNELIKGAFQVFSTLARLQAAPIARLTDGQIVWVEGESALYQLSITLANPPFTFTDTYTWSEFTGFGGASIPSGTISGSSQIAELGYLTSASAAAAGFGSGGGTATDISALNLFTGSAQTSLSALNSATSSYALKTDISGAFTSVSGGLAGRITTLEGTAGGSTDITALNLFTGSAQTSLTALNSATSSYLTSANTGSFILVSQTSSMSVLSALTASFIGNLNYNFITNLPNLISSSTQIALLGAGLLSSSAQIASQISGSFTSLSASFAARLDSLNVGGGIFQLTGSSYNTTNNIQITGSLSVGSGSFKSFEVNSDGFVVLGDMDKDLNTAPIGTVVYSGSNFYLIS